MDKRITIAGIGPGHKDYMTPAAAKAIMESDVLLGGQRNLELFRYLEKEEVVIGSRVDEMVDHVRELAQKKNLVVLASGDPGIYSISQTLRKRLPEVAFTVIPGISSLQVLCARLHTPWEDVHCTSLHGREPVALSPILAQHSKVAFFTGGSTSPEGVCRALAASGMNDLTVTVGENLSYENERIISGTPAHIAGMTFDSLSIMLVERNDPVRDQPEAIIQEKWDYAVPGIPDHRFLRGEVPMTKEEVRAVAVSKLRLRPHSVVYDIGAGTGSVAIECGLLAPKGCVYAIDQHPAAIDLIHRNREAYGLNNVVAVEGKAPEILRDLPRPHRVFIGGSGGSMGAILDTIAAWDHPCRVVITAVVLESVSEALEGLKEKGFEGLEVINLAVSRSRKVGNRHMMQALNPVTIISGEHCPKGQKEDRP